MSDLLDTIYGPLSADVRSDDLIYRFLRAYGEWALLECDMASILVPALGTVLDGGACLGTFSLGMAMRGAKGLISVEPNPEIEACLRANLERNCKIPFRFVQAAIGVPGPQAVKLQIDRKNSGAARVIEASADQAGPSVTVEPLSAIREKNGPYDLLKLDLEGSEFDALRSDARFIRESCRAAFLECNDTDNGDPIFEFLTWAGFHVFYFAFPAFNPSNYRGNSERIFPMSYEGCLIGVRQADLKLTQHLIDKECILKPIRSLDELQQARWLTPRWAREEWVGLSRVELIALAGRLSLSQKVSGVWTKSES